MANHITRHKRPLAIFPTTPVQVVYWPAWRYHPKTGKGKIFADPEEVPEGWVEHFDESDHGQKLAAGEAAERDDADIYASPGAQMVLEEPDELEDIAEIDVRTIKQRLDARGVSYANSANKTQLYQLLEENWVEE